MQQLGSPILEMLLVQGFQRRGGALRTLRGTWQAYRSGGIGGALVAFVSAAAGIGPDPANGLASALAAFQSDQSTDPALRGILSKLRLHDDLAAAVGDATLSALSARSGLSRSAVLDRLSQTLPRLQQSQTNDL